MEGFLNCVAMASDRNLTRFFLSTLFSLLCSRCRTLTESVKEKSVSAMMTRHLIPCSLAYSYCSVRLGSGVGTNSALKFSSHNSATSSMRSTRRPPPPLEQTRILVVPSFLKQLRKTN
ncbi:hypothetical protein V8G54_025154 [Vigna mungo]|uniref:Uncharacterized protein n=1 Tax=Vigna mungo TaxID=3915 RepID=A0AAQ3N8Z0_VIGMU